MSNILLFDKNPYTFDFSNMSSSDTVTQADMFNSTIPYRTLQMLRNFSVVSCRAAFGKWYHFRKSFDGFILPDASFNLNVLKLFVRDNLDDRCILYYRNRIRKRDIAKIIYAKYHHFVLATYSKIDAEKYTMAFVPQFWNPVSCCMTNEKFDRDVYFIGEVKNRYKEIMYVKEQCDLHNVTSLFQIISRNTNLPNTQRERVDYSEVLSYMKTSRALVDIVTDDNWGLTIRPLEALMSEKKLITNFYDIKKYDFYDENADNIFIVGEDSWDCFESFLRKPFSKGSQIINEYTSKSWIKRMIALLPMISR